MLQELASSKSAGQTSRLEIRVKVGGEVLTPKSVGQASELGKQAGFYIIIFRLISFFFGKLQSLFSRPSADWMRTMKIVENILLFLKSKKYLHNSICEVVSPKNLVSEPSQAYT